MKWTKTSMIYGCLIGLSKGYNGRKSKICFDECGKKKNVNKEKNKAIVWELDSSIIKRIESEPIACKLLEAELVERKEALHKEIFSSIKKVDEVKTGYVFSFDYDEGFLAKMTDYIIYENNCCPFFVFEIKIYSKNDVLLKITGPVEAKKMLKNFLTEKVTSITPNIYNDNYCRAHD